MKQSQWSELEAEILQCRRCDRLTVWREEIARIKRRAYRDQEYWGKPVVGFGDREAQVLIVGLAPGAHGANRTGRMFTGDSAGDFLYRALYKAGFANQLHSNHREDGMKLNNVFISAVCRCVPPQNKPSPAEIRNCATYLYRELKLLTRLRIIVALGRIAFEQTVLYFEFSPKPAFRHGNIYFPPRSSIVLMASYHPSRQNTQTGRLNEQMFDEIWEKVKSILQGD